MTETIVARVLSIPTTAEDYEIEKFLSKHIPGSNAKIFSFVPDPDTGSKMSTVHLASKSKNAAKQDIQRFLEKGIPFRDGRGPPSELHIDSSCLDITLLSRSDDEPTFEYVCMINSIPISHI